MQEHNAAKADNDDAVDNVDSLRHKIHRFATKPTDEYRLTC